MKFASVRVEPFVLGPQGVRERDPSPYLSRAQATCLERLVASGIFASVAAVGADEPATGPTLMVHAELTELRIVGSTMRFLFGGQAGDSVMTFNVTLRDAGTGVVVRSGAVADWSPGTWKGERDESLAETVGAGVAEFVELGARR